MPFYSYKAVAPDGEVISGVLEEPSQEAAIERIHSLGQVPIRVSASASGSRSGSALSLFKKKVSNEEIAIFTRELSSLSTIISLAESDSLQSKTVTNILDSVKNGASLAAALEMQNGTFNTLYVSLVKAGEASL